MGLRDGKDYNSGRQFKRCEVCGKLMNGDPGSWTVCSFTCLKERSLIYEAAADLAQKEKTKGPL